MTFLDLVEKYGIKGQKGAPGETGGKRLRGPPVRNYLQIIHYFKLKNFNTKYW